MSAPDAIGPQVIEENYVAFCRTMCGRRIGAVMTVHALRHAQALGARAAILLSSPMGERIYQRLGFVERCRVGQYLWLPRDADA